VNPNTFGRANARACLLCLATILSFPMMACSGSSSTDGGGDAGPAGGPVDGGPDDHCTVGDDGGFLIPDGGLFIQPTDQAVCQQDAGGVDATDFGPTHPGTIAYDDDCKYQVSWSATPIRENADVTFTIVVTDLSTQGPLTGANPYIEAFLSSTHPGDTASAVTKESPPGTYSIGPVHFDAPGTWTVRYHLFGDCTDASDESPHGHAAFFVEVP